MKFTTLYDHGRARSMLFATENTEDSMTQQSDAKDADINVLMSRYSKTGQVPQVLENPVYGDFSNITDYRSALDALRDADEKFGELPAKIRAEFKNDPAEFLNFAQNPENLDKMREMGLAPKPPKSDNPPLNAEIRPAPVTPPPTTQPVQPSVTTPPAPPTPPKG